MHDHLKVLGSAAFPVMLAAVLVSCAKLKDDVPAPVAPAGVHEDSWNVAASPEFHGRYLKAKQWNTSECAPCHAQNFVGGLSNVSCFTCHDAYPHSARFTAGGHPVYLALTLYPLPQCQSCHGPAYTGGSVVDVSCSTAGCHVDRTGAAKSPEACNTCHGDFRAPASDQLSAAPPKSVAGDTVTTVPGVGAHRAHLVAGLAGKTVKCIECHTVPTSTFAAGHIDGTPRAEVAFNDTLARLTTGGGTFTPSGVAYDAATFRCSNTYCHGNWRARRSSAPPAYQFGYVDSVMRGSNGSPVWTAGAAGAACGTCHGLPPTGHIPADTNTCGNCHGEVVNNNLMIIGPTKHINGKINIFTVERAF